MDQSSTADLRMPEGMPNAFRVGQVIFRLGDMDDDNVLWKSEVIVLPNTDDDAKVSVHISSIIKKIGAKGILPDYYLLTYTELLDRQVNPTVVIYATSVEQIHSTCLNILRETNDYEFVSLPMLQIGGVLPIQVAKVFDDVFNYSAKTTFIVHVKDENTFEELRNFFSLNAYPVDPNFFRQKPSIILKLEGIFNCKFFEKDYEVDNQGVLNYLFLKRASIDKNFFYLEGIQLVSLSLFDCKIEDWNSLRIQNKLVHLSLMKVEINDFSFLQDFPLLKILKLRFCKLKEINFVKFIPGIETLNLANNQISEIEEIIILGKIFSLDMSANRIKTIDSLDNLKFLTYLNLRDNQIESIVSLKNLKIETLLLSNNLISDISPIKTLRRLTRLQADKNSFLQDTDVILEKGKNHLKTLKAFLSRKDEAHKIRLQLPVKVLLLGNHATGKSTLLQYLENSKVFTTSQSTHIINIRRIGENESGLPTAIFYDFGGQDYYHGIYRAFLSGGSLNLLLWNTGNNINSIRKDASGVLTQDFNVSYWLSQKKYLETEKYGNVADPLLLIQTHADLEGKEFLRDMGYNHRIDNEFYVCLQKIEGESEVNKSARRYLKAYINELIKKNITEREEPEWYVKFLKFIDDEGKIDSYMPKSVKEDILPHYGEKVRDKETNLKEALDQLHKRGLVLYYKDMLPDHVWLNPVALVKYIHSSILDAGNAALKGGRVPQTYFNQFPEEIVRLLELQKVIFRHALDNETTEYIVPNFLPLSQETDPDLGLFLFEIGSPLFILKFTQFIPFGLINQMICGFGTLPDKKKFWRNQFLFTFESKAKILIKLNFQQLEISVCASFKSGIEAEEKLSITKYLFHGIMTLFWDMELLTYNEFIDVIEKGKIQDGISDEQMIKYNNAERIYEVEACRPYDLYISTDEVYYVHYAQLCLIETPVIPAYKDGNFEKSSEVIPIYPFEAFARRKLKKALKVAISYSKQDLEMVDKFRQYLMPLVDDGLIENPWYCTMLRAGEDWNAEIKSRFEAADIIFFMITENLMSTRYVMENEIKNAIDRWNRHGKVKIVPILLNFYHWARKGEYDLSKFNGLPYSLKPVSDFKNQGIAWYMIEESLRIMIEKNLNPLKEDENFSREMQELHQRIMAGKNYADL